MRVLRRIALTCILAFAPSVALAQFDKLPAEAVELLESLRQPDTRAERIIANLPPRVFDELVRVYFDDEDEAIRRVTYTLRHISGEDASELTFDKESLRKISLSGFDQSWAIKACNENTSLPRLPLEVCFDVILMSLACKGWRLNPTHAFPGAAFFHIFGPENNVEWVQRTTVDAPSASPIPLELAVSELLDVLEDDWTLRLTHVPEEYVRHWREFGEDAAQAEMERLEERYAPGSVPEGVAKRIEELPQSEINYALERLSEQFNPSFETVFDRDTVRKIGSFWVVTSCMISVQHVGESDLDVCFENLFFVDGSTGSVLSVIDFPYSWGFVHHLLAEMNVSMRVSHTVVDLSADDARTTKQ